MSAKTPQQMHVFFRDGFNAGSPDALLALYEDKACLLTPSGATSTGKAAVREALTPFLALKLPIGLETVSCTECGDLGLLSARWVVDGKDPAGNPVHLTGTSSEVVRRQADGTWLYVIDDPGY